MHTPIPCTKSHFQYKKFVQPGIVIGIAGAHSIGYRAPARYRSNPNAERDGSSSFEELCRTTDERLFNSIADNKHHVLHYILPPKCEASQCYNLHPRTHNFKLPERSTHLTHCSYTERMLFLDVY